MRIRKRIIHILMNILNKRTLKTKLIFVFIFTSVIVLVVNMYMYININQTLKLINHVYVSNVSLNELTTTLTKVQNSMYQYLDTKSSDALEEYYRNRQTFSEYVEKLNNSATDNHIKLMEKNIKNMSLEYLELTNDTVMSKRGRNIQKYKEGYEKATDLYGYMNTNIYSLNNELFRNNSNNYELLLVSLRYLETISTIILLVISLLNVVFIIIVTGRITKPITKLSRVANEVAEGNYNVQFEESGYENEVGVLAIAFNKMIKSINENIVKMKENMEFKSKVVEKELIMKNHLKDAQLKYLQAQINPHFLFNTLNAGYQLAIMEDAERTSLLIEQMSEFFRYNIKKINEDANLKEEIELVDHYIYIMNVRFSGEISFVKEIDERFLTVRVPSMILQPIVENSVNYGIRDIDHAGRILLSIREENDKIRISVQDNGKGMDHELIDKVMKNERKEEEIQKKSNGIGLSNVISRLELYYSSENILEIKSEGENKGTEVIIRIPKDII